jgi:hypothetical protein
MDSKYSTIKTLIGIMLLVMSYVLAVTVISQHALVHGQIVNGQITDVDVAEAEEAGNTTIMTNQTTNGNSTAVKFLAIQNAHDGSISRINETAYTLELNNVSDNTILVADRPNRIVTSISTADFVGNWTAGPDSFASDAPNDALIVENTQKGRLNTAIIELFNPMYDVTANTLTYTIMTENATSINLSSEFGHSVEVIDSTGNQKIPPY